MCGRDPGVAVGEEDPGFGDRHRQDPADVFAAQLVVGAANPVADRGDT